MTTIQNFNGSLLIKYKSVKLFVLTKIAVMCSKWTIALNCRCLTVKIVLSSFGSELRGGSCSVAAFLPSTALIWPSAQFYGTFGWCSGGNQHGTHHCAQLWGESPPAVCLVGHGFLLRCLCNLCNFLEHFCIRPSGCADPNSAIGSHRSASERAPTERFSWLWNLFANEEMWNGPLMSNCYNRSYDHWIFIIIVIDRIFISTTWQRA